MDFGDDMDVGCALKTNVLCALLSMYVSTHKTKRAQNSGLLWPVIFCD